MICDGSRKVCVTCMANLYDPSSLLCSRCSVDVSLDARAVNRTVTDFKAVIQRALCAFLIKIYNANNFRSDIFNLDIDDLGRSLQKRELIRYWNCHFWRRSRSHWTCAPRSFAWFQFVNKVSQHTFSLISQTSKKTVMSCRKMSFTYIYPPALKPVRPIG